MQPWLHFQFLISGHLTSTIPGRLRGPSIIHVLFEIVHATACPIVSHDSLAPSFLSTSPTAIPICAAAYFSSSSPLCAKNFRSHSSQPAKLIRPRSPSDIRYWVQCTMHGEHLKDFPLSTFELWLVQNCYTVSSYSHSPCVACCSRVPREKFVCFFFI